MCNNSLEGWLNSSYLSKSNQSYIEQIYEDFLKNPHSVSSDWRKIFTQLSTSKNYSIKNNTSSRTNNNILFDNASYAINDSNKTFIYMKILQLIDTFRKYGHQNSDLDPLNIWNRTCKHDLLKLEYYQFTSQDFQGIFDMKFFGIDQDAMNITKIYEFLKKTYCGSIGIDFTHILDVNTILWIQKYFESKNKKNCSFHIEEKKQFLKEIIAAEGIERYLGTTFPGVKRFSLEGGDVLIPMLKEIIRYSTCYHDIKEIFLGMAHRGRLNVLINILGKNPQDLFNEFSNQKKDFFGSGDVKYHQGFSSNITVNKRTTCISLLYNPSHLEIVGPVVMGAARARIDQICNNLNNYSDDDSSATVLPIKIHGDAAISAQGIVQETFNMSKTRAYNVGGTIHIVINNQIGFTTSNIHDIRSTQYCTDIAKMVQSPIFHVNADNVESVIYVSRAALDFRKKFRCDVIIDLVCYRRHGHNEADEPSVTQPLMYQKIRNHPTLLHIYSNSLIQKGIIRAEDNIKMIHSYRKKLEKEHCVLEQWQPVHIKSTFHINNVKDNNKPIDIKKITTQDLQKLAYHINNIPSNIIMHSRVQKIYQDRMEMALGNRLFDWGGAETLAYAMLLKQGISIRLSGEDATRGTFFHRHTIIYDQNNGTEYIPLKNITKNIKGAFSIWDSVLSEEAALAFEYGYSCIANKMLIIWEAQFGDFSNGAQVVIDQFISSSEQKWGQLCGLVMLLPHGYEGQGPEHSSARIERYLQLCAEYNMRICIPSTPAQIYHILIQQAMLDDIHKKPLIIASPKSLLRHPAATSSLEELAYGSFKTIFKEINKKIILHQIYRVIICTGKIYYDLLHQRQKNKQYTISIIRIEQLYPFPYEDIEEVISSYTHVQNFIWCQEEPENQGAWYYIKNCFYNLKIKIELNYIGRPASAAPAVGCFIVHQEQHKKIIDEACNLY